MRVYSCDFETNNHEENCFVWAVGVYEIYSGWYKSYNNITEFLDLLAVGGKFYFHNLKFDGAFLLNEFLKIGLKYVDNPNKVSPGEFSTIISDTKVFYKIVVNLEFKPAHIYDSLKIIPASVKEIPKMFGLEESKGEIDYNKERAWGYIMTSEEADYLKRDCIIVGKALKRLYDQDLNSMTTASNAFKYFKNMWGDEYNYLFPTPDYDDDIRGAYKGGYCIANEKFINQDIGKGIVLDKNSMYPWVMVTKLLPFGKPIKFIGKYRYDKVYPLYIYSFRCQFELKEGYLPTLQIKNGRLGFMPTEYLKSSNGKEVVLTLTNIDYELFKKHYDIFFEEPIGGYKFMGTTKLFKGYVEHWYKVKEEATKEGNAVMRTIAKLMLNSLYGKFGSRIKRSHSIPYLDEEGILRFKVSDEENVKGKYLPVACFITAYAREDLINSAQANIDRFLYADTDSLHLIGFDKPQGLKIDKYKLGAWKIESKFTRGRYIRAKRYLEVIKNKYKVKKLLIRGKIIRKGKIIYLWKEKMDVKCCGLPSHCHHLVTWENFKPGMVYGGKLQHRNVKGGAILTEINFTLK